MLARWIERHAVIVAAVVLVLVAGLGAWAGNRLQGLTNVTGDLSVAGSATIGDDLTIADNLTCVDDVVFSDRLAVAGETVLSDSTYIAENVTLSAGKSLRTTYIGLLEVSGAFPDTAGLVAGTMAMRGDTMYVLKKGKASWGYWNPS